ncbi:MAG: class I SAM-dependent methyltransferase [Gammaproteobacteria bacterium]|nr:class I SAM-dependent methyltransferase [Gammaproteobacteria bacterium]
MKLPINIDRIKGFLAEDEGAALFDSAIKAANFGPILEIGSYCGKSTVYLGTAAKETGNTVFAVDHHRGSEEHQIGEGYFDESLFDAQRQKVDTFGEFRDTLSQAKLEDTVVPIVAPTKVAAKHWRTPLGLVFIDGGHSMEAALNDYRCWTPHLVTGGYLLIHDIFPDPKDGGRPPFEIFELAKASGQFELITMVNTLGIMRRL